MWDWLRAIAEVRELRQRLADEQDRVADLETRLFAEIESNRRREDGLVDFLTRNTRGVLSTRQLTPRVDAEVEAAEEPQFDAEQEDLIRQRATEFWQADLANGPTANLDIYIAAIKDNPGKYLDY